MTVMQLLTSFKFRYFNLLRICHTHTLNTNDNSLLHIYPNDELYMLVMPYVYNVGCYSI